MQDIKTDLPTHLEAKTALDSALSAFADSAPINEQDIKTASLGISNSIQIRDYALGGIPLVLTDYQDITRFMNLLEGIGGASAGASAIFGAFTYEAGYTQEAHTYLDKSLELQNGYSLALLLRRVFSAGWPPASFASMRRELHPRVEAGLKDLEEVLVNASR